MKPSHRRSDGKLEVQRRVVWLLVIGERKLRCLRRPDAPGYVLQAFVGGKWLASPLASSVSPRAQLVTAVGSRWTALALQAQTGK